VELIALRYVNEKKVFEAALFPLFPEKKVIEYVEQQVTTLVMIYSPTVNDTQYPLGTATTCPADRYTCADLVSEIHSGQVWSNLVPRVYVPPDQRQENTRPWELPFQACGIFFCYFM